jgi:hypothetical protein
MFLKGKWALLGQANLPGYDLLKVRTENSRSEARVKWRSGGFKYYLIERIFTAKAERSFGLMTMLFFPDKIQFIWNITTIAVWGDSQIIFNVALIYNK